MNELKARTQLLSIAELLQFSPATISQLSVLQEDTVLQFLAVIKDLAMSFYEEPNVIELSDGVKITLSKVRHADKYSFVVSSGGTAISSGAQFTSDIAALLTACDRCIQLSNQRELANKRQIEADEADETEDKMEVLDK